MVSLQLYNTRQLLSIKERLLVIEGRSQVAPKSSNFQYNKIVSLQEYTEFKLKVQDESYKRSLVSSFKEFKIKNKYWIFIQIEYCKRFLSKDMRLSVTTVMKSLVDTGLLASFNRSGKGKHSFSEVLLSLIHI